MRGALLLLVLGAIGIAGCQAITRTPSATAGPIGQFGGRPVLGISNGTPMVVTLYLNGRVVETGLEPIDFASLPPLPWRVEARSPSGRVLTSMQVTTGDVWSTTDPSGNVETNGAMGRVDLSCGRITIWAGYYAPSGPPPASPAGSPGDCTP